ncbi:MAG: hypothetical protein VYA72_00485 [Bacteroidota bacterium]|nr:hypothetical protein [Bacteroidota bacterium]
MTFHREQVHLDAATRITLCLAGAIGPVRDVLAADGLLATGAPSFQLDIHDALQEHRHPGTVSPLHQSIAQQHS